MINCIDKQENPDQELDNLKDWSKKEITFAAKRGRKGRYEVARTKGRLVGVDFMRDRFGLSDVYPESDMEKIWKKAKIMARLYGYSDKELPRKISRADFDLWWLEGRESARTNPLIRKGTLVGDTQLYRQSFHQPSYRIDKIDWEINRAKGVIAHPESYYAVLSKIDKVDPTHTIGKGSAAAILPLNKHWQEVSGFVQSTTLQYIYAWSKDETFKVQFNINYIQEIKKEIGFKGSWQAFVQKNSSFKGKFYLNDQRNTSSGLLMIYGQSFYVIAPRVDW